MSVNGRRDFAVLFDLDDTLVQTRALRRLRDSRDWPRVYAAFDQSSLAPGTVEMLSAITAVAQTGVVTMAPRPYAERLLQHHGLQVPVVVAYHDVARRKPNPEPILKAAELLNVRPEFVIYIGDEVRDIVAANRAGAHAIAYGDGTLENDPEAAGAFSFADDWAGVRDAVRAIINA